VVAVVPPEDRDRVKANLSARLEAEGHYGIEHWIMLPDGRKRFVHERAETFFDKTGKPLRLTGTVQDISERKAAEVALRETERLAREQLESRVEERTRELTALNENLHREVGERKQAEEALSRSLLDQEIMLTILQLSLKPLPLVEILRQSLVLVLQGHGFGLTPQGCVFRWCSKIVHGFQ